MTGQKTMPRPAVLVFLLMMIVWTCRIELKPPFGEEVSAVSATNLLNYRFLESQDSLIKEKIILSQEQSIQKLNELAQNLKYQLDLCRAGWIPGVNDTTPSVIELLNEIEGP